MTNKQKSPDVRIANVFLKDLKRLKKKYPKIRNDIEPIIEALQKGETPGDRIQGTQHYVVYKERAKNSDANKGKSGGYRIIYQIVDVQNVILLTIYSKTDQPDISAKVIVEIITEEA